ncbi:MAG TPA: tripartite tricarboxylate transporter substrate binding protein [Xanthobacteraceae bacterium]|nr:tripartite tricarboxylate transporter substrate binding protein [Xanthobacteraceae bacterium]
MPLSRRTLLCALAATPAAAVFARPAFATYPDRPIRLIVPFAAGGNADTVARLTADGMAAVLGQPIVVENRAGAGGSIGAEAVARAEPDGYTLLTGSNGPLTVNPFVQAKLGYDPMTDFTPIGLTSLVAHALAVHPSVSAKTLEEVVALSHKQQIGIGTAGVGSATHLTLARFNAATGAKLVHVPYRGGGALLPDLIGGAIQGAMVEFSTVLPLHQGGKSRILATAAPKRSELADDIPTMIEAGVKDFTAASYVGVLAPAKTPAEAVAKLEQALGKALAVAETVAKFKKLGTDMATSEQMTSRGFAAFLKTEYARSREAAALAGLTKS